MSTWGDKIGRDGRPQLGVGVSIPPGTEPKPESIMHTDWRQGLVSYESPEDVPQNGAVDLMDVESLETDALIRAPGIAEVEDVSPNVLDWIFEHASVNYAVALIAIDPPDIGVKDTGAFVFTNEGIAATGAGGAWHVANVAGILIFSNGIDAAYLRDWDTGVITDISAEIVAKTFANAFGRTFAGAWTDGVTGLQALGVKWNASSADPADWSGIGSGNELLISNQPEADRVVALRPIGFDLLAILCRRNLWLGYETGEDDRPADFRVRFPGVGCVWERTAVVTPIGVIFLSDDGVRLFNVNETKILSGAVNDRLLPLDYLNLDQYYAVYNPQVQAYQLYTPTGVFIYQLPLEIPGLPSRPGRWYLRSYIGDSAAIFSPQNNNLFWSTIAGTWLDQLITWAEASIGEDLAPPVVYNGQGSLLGVENYGTEDYFGDAQTPFWTARQDNDRTTDLIITQCIEVEYESGAASEISIEVFDEDGNDVTGITKTLPNSNNKRIKRLIWFTVTGVGTGFKLNITDGAPEIFRIRHVFDGVAPTTQAL